ncbi:MAG TPA: phosphorylase [Polyangia bacterium]
MPATARGPILVVAAWEPELAGLGTLRASSPAKLIRGTVGVGLIEAAAGAARLIAQTKPRAVFLVGTGGVYPGARIAPPIGSAVIAQSLCLASASVATEAAYLPAPLPAACDATPRLVRAAAAATRLPRAIVACPLGISGTGALARRLQAATGADVENLEAFAVARAAAAAGVAFAGVLGISNVVGPQSHAQWRAHAEASAYAACVAVRATLTRLGFIAPDAAPSGRPARGLARRQ